MPESPEWLRSIKPHNIAEFFDSVVGRAPGPNATGEPGEARSRMAHAAGRLHAQMLGRPFDERVPRDLDHLTETIAARARRYTSDDWAQTIDGDTVLQHARVAIGLISAELRGQRPDDDDHDDGWGDLDDDAAVD